MTKILNVQGLEKSYLSGSRKLKVLDDISFSVNSGETFAIVGPSGSGKTTLLGSAPDWIMSIQDIFIFPVPIWVA